MQKTILILKLNIWKIYFNKDKSLKNNKKHKQ